jgi:hypothetical protein
MSLLGERRTRVAVVVLVAAILGIGVVLFAVMYLFVSR